MRILPLLLAWMPDCNGVLTEGESAVATLRRQRLQMEIRLGDKNLAALSAKEKALRSAPSCSRSRRTPPAFPRKGLCSLLALSSKD
jgi:hypothetical protein